MEGKNTTVCAGKLGYFFLRLAADWHASCLAFFCQADTGLYAVARSTAIANLPDSCYVQVKWTFR